MDADLRHRPLRQSPPWLTPWPLEDLYHIEACPICGGAERKSLHKALIDNVFYCALGRWTSWRCSACGSAYLDPCPSPASIHLAYQSYYTHDAAQALPEKPDYATLTPLKKLRRRILNGYTNRRYATNEHPALAIGALAIWLALPFKLNFDRKCRHLPRLPEGGGTVLDVGCGDGSFMEIAAWLGWTAIGVDPDPSAVANCLRRGLNVRQGGIDQFAGSENLFDAITLSHVIEHVHDPMALLKDCLRLLKPGGQLSLETPNIDSFGHWLYGPNWRGLEPPRHLVLFNETSLFEALKRAGFWHVGRNPLPSPLEHLARVSEAMKRGRPIDEPIRFDPWTRLKVLEGRFIQLFFPHVREFLTVCALKEGGGAAHSTKTLRDDGGLR